VGAAAACGAALGAVLGPLALWTLLREVPVGRAVLLGALGTAVGGLAARWAPGTLAPACALAGFGAAVALLARQRGRTRVVVPARPNVALHLPGTRGETGAAAEPAVGVAGRAPFARK
jgi:hypothetical protein